MLQTNTGEEFPASGYTCLLYNIDIKSNVKDIHYFTLTTTTSS